MDLGVEGRDAEEFEEFSFSLGNRGGVNEVSDWAEERAVALAEVEFHFWIGPFRLARGLNPRWVGC